MLFTKKKNNKKMLRLAYHYNTNISICCLK